jgi:hypothetical protein
MMPSDADSEQQMQDDPDDDTYGSSPGQRGSRKGGSTSKRRRHSWERHLDPSLPPQEMKKMRRMLSNRESARRSRRRKQAHMAELEGQVQKLVNEKARVVKEKAALQASLDDAQHLMQTLRTEADMLRKKIQFMAAGGVLAPEELQRLSMVSHSTGASEQDHSMGSDSLSLPVPVVSPATVGGGPVSPRRITRQGSMGKTGQNAGTAAGKAGLPSLLVGSKTTQMGGGTTGGASNPNSPTSMARQGSGPGSPGAKRRGKKAN